jgi:hypothetical protein
VTVCAAGRVVANAAFTPAFPFGTDLEGRFLYLADGERRWLLAAFDFSYMWRSTCLEWRRRVSQATGIPVPCIWVHMTQSHSAPTAPELSGAACERLGDLSLPEIQRMIAEAEESQMAYVIPDLGTRFNFRRERYVPELGAVTVWSGQLELAEGRPPFTRDPSVMLLGDWAPDLPAFKQDIYFDRPVDGQVALLVFRGASGKILGTLTRFSGHPDIATSHTNFGARMDEYRYHHDWPGYVRRAVDDELGALGVCVNGPCGDVSVRASCGGSYAEADAEARRAGEGVAGACLAAWHEHEPAWETVRMGAPAAGRVKLPLRDTLPCSRAELLSGRAREQKLDAMRKQVNDARAAGAPPAHIKRLIDEQHHQFWLAALVEKWVGLSDEELGSRFSEVEVQALRLNDLVLCGLPAESMTDTSLWLKAQTYGSRLITIDQVNGYCSYLTTSDQYAQGGYSYWGGGHAVDAEAILRQAALELIHRSRDGA